MMEQKETLCLKQVRMEGSEDISHPCLQGRCSLPVLQRVKQRFREVRLGDEGQRGQACKWGSLTSQRRGSK